MFPCSKFPAISASVEPMQLNFSYLGLAVHAFAFLLYQPQLVFIPFLPFSLI